MLHRELEIGRFNVGAARYSRNVHFRAQQAQTVTGAAPLPHSCPAWCCRAWPRSSWRYEKPMLLTKRAPKDCRSGPPALPARWKPKTWCPRCSRRTRRRLPPSYQDNHWPPGGWGIIGPARAQGGLLPAAPGDEADPGGKENRPSKARHGPGGDSQGEGNA